MFLVKRCSTYVGNPEMLIPCDSQTSDRLHTKKLSWNFLVVHKRFVGKYFWLVSSGIIQSNQLHIYINNYLFIYSLFRNPGNLVGPVQGPKAPKVFPIPTSLKFRDEAHVWTTQKHLFDAWVDLVAHSSFELSIGGKNYKSKAINERLNVFARGLFEDVKAEGYRWVKKENLACVWIIFLIY